MNQMQSRRSLIRAGGAAGMLTMLAACGGATAQEAKPALTNAPVTIKYYKRSQLDDAKTQQLLVDWNKAHPTWTVDMVQAVNDDQKLGTYAAAGEKMETTT